MALIRLPPLIPTPRQQLRRRRGGEDAFNQVMGPQEIDLRRNIPQDRDVFRICVAAPQRPATVNLPWR